jgi:hypothetical protein
LGFGDAEIGSLRAWGFSARPHDFNMPASAMPLAAFASLSRACRGVTDINEFNNLTAT